MTATMAKRPAADPRQLALPLVDRIRDRIANHLRTLATPERASTIAARLGIGYKTTIDALNALHNSGKAQRIGHKFTARWASPVWKGEKALRVEDFWRLAPPARPPAAPDGPGTPGGEVERGGPDQDPSQ